MTLNAKFIAGGHVSPGLVVHLTYSQVNARRHLLTPVNGVHKDKTDQRRLPYTAERMLFFKAGEELGIDGTIDRQLQNAIGATDEQLTDADAARPGTRKAVAKRRARGGKSAAVKAAEKVLRDAEADAAEAEVKLKAAAPDDRAGLQKALDDAKGAVLAAQEALTRAGA